MSSDVNVDMITSYHKRQESLIAAHDILKELESNDSLPDDMKKIFSDLNSKLSSMEVNIDFNDSKPVQVSKDKDISDVKDKFKFVHDKIMDWDKKSETIWESGLESVEEYIELVKEIVRLLELFRKEGNYDGDMISQGDVVLQVAMVRLEEELTFVLGQRRRTYIPSEVEDDNLDGSSCDLVKKDLEVGFDLIDLETVPFLKSIRKVMFDSGYDQEFCRVYVKTEKEAIEECLIDLGMETVSIDELVKMDWDTLSSKIKLWTQVIKTGIRVYFLSEKRLIDEVFGECESSALLCLVNITKSAMTCLFNFGHAIALGPHTPEKLFHLFDMYEVLGQVQDPINTIFGGEEGSSVKVGFQEVKERIGESARATFLGFGDVILSNPSTDPFPGGGVHPLSSYVMNYIIVYLPDYLDTLNTLLEEKGKIVNSITTTTTPEKSALGFEIRSIADKLKSNLEKKSKLYKDESLQHVFLMNNTHYIQQKVLNSELQKIFGDEWIRTQIVNYQKYATSYVRTTWTSLLANLRDNGIPSGSGSGVKLALKEKIRVFNNAFEEVYKTQTGWFIRDEQLKEELRISISQRVILAYQSFIGRHSKYDIERYVKYDSEELENLIRDFFEGFQKSLNHRRR